ncbi:MAG: PBP1A family penicillin-binding protein [Eubacteriales bacterium]|nr:PBP1A family penicillin-binding protein [Eubacteriales bacterium]
MFQTQNTSFGSDQEDEFRGTDEPSYQPPEQDDEDFVPAKRRSIFKPRLTKPNFIFSVLVNALRILFIVVIMCGLALGGAVLGIAKGYMETAPTLDLALLSDQDKTSFLYDSNGNVITDYKGTENRVMVNISAMPENLCNAFVAVEDARFYTHNGIDVKRIIGSFVQNFTSGSQQGGSTITQQLIKNTVLSSEQSYKRKIQEAYLAMQLETQYTKAQILECYLNTIYMGENYYGVEVAAQGYFGKELSELTLRECAMLAGLTNNPYYYNPRRNFYIRTSETTDYQKLTNDRTDYVLRCMYENQFITNAQYQEALSQATANVLQESTTEGDGMYQYAHYVEYAVSDIVDCFLKLKGLEDTSENRYKMENELRTGGYHVTLAIDTEIQQTVEDTLDSWTNYPALRDPSDKIYRTRNNDGSYTEVDQPQAAAVVLDYRTGELKAIVGSRHPPTQRKTLNRAVNMKMPIGSTIKPIAVYAPALELGASPASVVYNIPVPIAGWTGSDGKDTWPRNYGGSGYVGPETLRTAMQQSHNVAAAQTLLNMVGVDRSVDYLMRMGVDQDHIDATPFGLSLGSSGITPLQLTVAYGVLANGGVYQQPISFLGISDSQGNVVYDSHAEQERRQVFRPSTSWLIIDMLKSVANNGTARSIKISGQTIAAKTGTNSDQRGVTFCGITGWYASAIWVGHDNYKPLSSKSTGSGSAGPIWESYMTKIHKAKNLENRDIVEVDPAELGLVKVTTCAVSGQLATEACANDSKGYGTVTDYWYEPTVPTVSCQMHQAMSVCSETGMVATQYCPYTTIRGVVVIPNGHPLSSYVNDPEYGPVVAEYMGTNSNYNYCTLHQDGYTGGGEGGYTDPIVENTLIPDAQQLIQNASTLMGQLDASSPLYQNIQNAIGNLQSLINSGNPSTADIANGMAALTQAMAGY